MLRFGEAGDEAPDCIEGQFCYFPIWPSRTDGSGVKVVAEVAISLKWQVDIADPVTLHDSMGVVYTRDSRV